MSQERKRIVVICPGRGTYNASELGYLRRFAPPNSPIINEVDSYRSARGLTPVSELDAAKTYDASLHASAANAPALIYACALSDFAALDLERLEVAAVTGNSMGWYLALAAAEVLNPASAIHLISTMGALTGSLHLGGQVIYPLLDSDWLPDPARQRAYDQALEELQSDPECQIYESIRLGGYRVVAGNEPALRKFQAALPKVDGRFPMRLLQHSAFHTPLMEEASYLALFQLPSSLFNPPRVPLMDGRGQVWDPQSTSLSGLRLYTLGAQVTETYDFTASIRNAVRNFEPDLLVLLGPGTNLMAPIGQILVEMEWKGLRSRKDFMALQERSPFVLAMGSESQRSLL